MAALNSWKFSEGWRSLRDAYRKGSARQEREWSGQSFKPLTHINPSLVYLTL